VTNRFFGLAAGHAKLMVALSLASAAKAFRDICSDRLRAFPQLRHMYEAAFAVIDEAIDLVRNKVGSVE
jgi:hypothetical protein